MRSMSDSLRTKLNNMVMTGADAPTCKVYRVYWDGSVWAEWEIPSVISVNISKDSEAFSQSATIVIHNVNPDDCTDYGYYNPHRNDAAHNKPQNDWYRQLVPNNRMRIYLGYGSELKTVFYGFVDTTEIDIRPDGSTLTLQCRDVGKILTDRSVNSTDDGVKSWFMEYPIGANTVTEHYITFAQGDTPDLADIIRDACMRAGFVSTDVITEPTGITIGDSWNGYFEYEDVTWDNVINDIKGITAHEFWIDEDGKAHFEKPLEKSLTSYQDEEVMLFGVPPTPQPLNNKCAIESTIVVKDFYTDVPFVKGIDWEYDFVNNGIKRIATGSIGVDEWTKVDYTVVEYVFKNGKNIFQLPLTLSHDDLYGQIRVKGDGVEATVRIEQDMNLWDGSSLWLDKVLVVDKEMLLEESECLAVANKMATTMKQKYVSMNFNCVAVPHLQLFDLIQITVYGTAGQLYLVTGIELSYQDNKMDMTIKCYNFGPLV